MEDLVAAPACRSCGSRARACRSPTWAARPWRTRTCAQEDLAKAEPFYPLTRLRLRASASSCSCRESATPEEIFSDYAYFSSYLRELARATPKAYVEQIIERLGLGPSSQVVEIASNDGYLLQYFVERGMPVLGVEPAANVADDGDRAGDPDPVAFFGSDDCRRRSRDEGIAADLVLGNNVLAHVPGPERLRRRHADPAQARGIVTIEFPHLLQLIEHTEFDTIYHEHFSYFSLLAVQQVFAAHGLRALRRRGAAQTHGGSLRIYVRHRRRPKPPRARVAELLARERAAGLDRLETYARVRASRCARPSATCSSS